MATITGVSIKRLLTYLLIFILYLRIRCLPKYNTATENTAYCRQGTFSSKIARQLETETGLAGIHHTTTAASKLAGI